MMTEQDPPAAPTTPAQQPLPTYPSFPAPAGYDSRRFMPPPSKTKAGWALGLACFPGLITWIISLILAIQVISDSKHRPGNGKGMAVAALIIIPVWIVLIVALVVAGAADDADRDASGEVIRSGDVLVTDVRTGDCIVDDFTGAEKYMVEVTPCSKAHALETYATFELPDGDFPGTGEVERMTVSRCLKHFKTFVGVEAEKSDLSISYIQPTDDSWSRDRGGACMVGTGKSTTGSLAQAKH